MSLVQFHSSWSLFTARAWNIADSCAN